MGCPCVMQGLRGRGRLAQHPGSHLLLLMVWVQAERRAQVPPRACKAAGVGWSCSVWDCLGLLGARGAPTPQPPPEEVTPAVKGSCGGQLCPPSSGKGQLQPSLHTWRSPEIPGRSSPQQRSLFIPVPCQHRASGLKNSGLGKDAHLDTEEHSDEKHGHQEEEEEHEEPGTPVQPVAEAHHVHVLLWGGHAVTQGCIHTSRAWPGARWRPWSGWWWWWLCPAALAKEVAVPGPTEVVLHSLQHHMVSPTSLDRGCHHHRRTSPQRAELNPKPQQLRPVGPPRSPSSGAEDRTTQCPGEAKPCTLSPAVTTSAELQPPPQHNSDTRVSTFRRQRSCFPDTELLESTKLLNPQVLPSLPATFQAKRNTSPSVRQPWPHSKESRAASWRQD